MERLQKVIANLGYCSRRNAEKLIKAGKVAVNGETVFELGIKVSKKDVIEVEGIILDRNYNYEYYLLNKPRGVITAVCDDRGRKTVVDLVPTSARIYPVGRLDYDTTGVLLLTNDGVLANGLMHPSSNIDKVYIAKVEGILTGYDVKRLRSGVMIDGYRTSKCHVKVKSVDKKKERCIVEIVIHEGRNHQVKKMIESVGKKVIKLKRERYAILDVSGLKAGDYRKLTNKEIAILYSMISQKEN
ncbi:MAG: rRNA pseudouridine synthase [Erysipelotrichaceae bacterium]|nr:rRNA pseudouridine synthase [Erysipelotrichaceae bacterium]